MTTAGVPVLPARRAPQEDLGRSLRHAPHRPRASACLV